jgi:hypothetical protein
METDHLSSLLLKSGYGSQAGCIIICVGSHRLLLHVIRFPVRQLRLSHAALARVTS